MSLRHSLKLIRVQDEAYCLGISLQDNELAIIVYMDALYKVHLQFAVGLASKVSECLKLLGCECATFEHIEI
jgi:hypothetical protein